VGLTSLQKTNRRAFLRDGMLLIISVRPVCGQKQTSFELDFSSVHQALRIAEAISDTTSKARNTKNRI
jgi:hypothetical protein